MSNVSPTQTILAVLPTMPVPQPVLSEPAPTQMPQPPAAMQQTAIPLGSAPTHVNDIALAGGPLARQAGQVIELTRYQHEGKVTVDYEPATFFHSFSLSLFWTKARKRMPWLAKISRMAAR